MATGDLRGKSTNGRIPERIMQPVPSSKQVDPLPKESIHTLQPANLGTSNRLDTPDQSDLSAKPAPASFPNPAA